ncbi:tripartite tricarboxylate transporter substrate binding protein [Blastococcus sp. BMG 814]|uniref:Tripartite tricarboxylate transporter substrate binding protein n=1 Tax=Blastococcus carthaginiensis TaxID=3050034 RepID=A0ABT9IE87_9ACTN|nr:tripartite tricarboxylate transporter substrate binding protein [Blastococcus carthaginiensis]MDP5183902.1 tripartite tricarboxylate transporter substrate binding protein [Blastococcus carthaginiensis]
MSKKKLVAVFGATVLSLGLAACGDDAGSGGTSAAGEAESDYPTDDLRFVVSYAAGGPTDVAGRAVAAYMEEQFGVNVVVENVEGASGSLGTAEVARAEPDGYTIGMTTGSAVARVPLIEDVGYGLEDLDMIGVATFGPGLLIVREDGPYDTLEELVEAAEAAPGTINIATAGPSTPQHVELERLARDYGVEFSPVPFPGEAPAVTALLGGNVAGCFCSNAQTTIAQVDSGEFKVLATSSPETLPTMPDVPTFVESGYEEIVYGNSYYVLVVPAGTPEDIVSTLEEALKGALEDEATVTVIGEERLLEPFMGADDLRAMLEQEQETLQPILEELFAGN